MNMKLMLDKVLLKQTNLNDKILAFRDREDLAIL